MGCPQSQQFSLVNQDDEDMQERYPVYAGKSSLDTSNKNMHASLAVATRVFLNSDATLNNQKINDMRNRLQAFCDQVFSYCNQLFIAVDAPHEQELRAIFEPVLRQYDANKYHVHYIVVSPWTGFTAALNAIIRSVSLAADREIKYLSFQSLEISRLSPKIVDVLMATYMDGNTLLCGPQLVETQMTEAADEKEMERELDVDGWNIPWNTLNIWNLAKLQAFGFSLVSDGIVENVPGGIEEVFTISLIQSINGLEHNRCKLIRFEGDGFDADNDVKWSTNFANDEQRLQYHEKKMKSKSSRADAQMKQFVNLKRGKVMHIRHTL